MKVSLSLVWFFSAPVDCGPPGSFIHGILQARILEWVDIPFSRGSSQPSSLALQADSLLSEPVAQKAQLRLHTPNLGLTPGQGTRVWSLVTGFPGGSTGKESACKVGDLGSIPGLGRPAGEGKGYPLQYSGLENSKDCRVLCGPLQPQRVRHDWVTFTFRDLDLQLRLDAGK